MKTKLLFILIILFCLSGSHCHPRFYTPPFNNTHDLRPLARNTKRSTAPPISAAVEAPKVTAQINTLRASNSTIPQLILDPIVSLTAQQHSADMVARHYFGHVSPPPNYTTTKERLLNNGYKVGDYGEQEIITKGHIDANDLMNPVDGITKSGYIQALMTGKWTKIGIGVTADKNNINYWVIIYATDPIP